MKPVFEIGVRLRAAIATFALSLSCLWQPAASAAPSSSPPRVQLAAGVIEGVRTEARGKGLSVFQGIPYAAPPVGELRWREPQSVARWTGVRRATDFGPRCMQLALYPILFRSRQMSEDCLYLNVWTPGRPDREKLPVLVYFHGSGFDAGDGSEGRYDGANFAARGIVTVTVNYRLGIFGFLALPESARESPHGAAGNYGFLDQVAALRWVRENIAQFGGDPDQVTIAGESGGAIFSQRAHGLAVIAKALRTRDRRKRRGVLADPPLAPKRSRGSGNAIRRPRRRDFVETTAHELGSRTAECNGSRGSACVPILAQHRRPFLAKYA